LQDLAILKRKACNIMKPKSQEFDPNGDFFKQELKEIIDPSHRLCLLADLLNWEAFEQGFSVYFSDEKGRAATPSRLIAGLFYLKSLYALSDDQLIHTWVENPYWQYLCGEQYFQHDFPIDRSTLSLWRKRIGPKGIEKLLTVVLEAASSQGYLSARELSRVIADTTVQEKAIRFPTDSWLYYHCREELLALCGFHFIPVRQSYVRLAKQALHQAGRYGHAKQYRRMKKEIKTLKNYLGRVTRDIERYCFEKELEYPALAEKLGQANRLLTQQKADKGKLYSLHAPEVECIAKGKAHKRYEFGVKVGLVTTAKAGWILCAKALHGNPYDGHTLSETLTQAIANTGITPEYAYADKGYRGHQEDRMQVFISGQKRGATAGIKRWMKRRSSIEPIIGHMKQSHGLGRNYLKGKAGDQINAICAAVGYNLTLLLKRLTPSLA